MRELADGGNKKQGELGVANVLVFLNLHGCDQYKKLQTDEKLKRWLTMKQHSFLVSRTVKTRKFEMKHSSVVETSTKIYFLFIFNLV